VSEQQFIQTGATAHLRTGLCLPQVKPVAGFPGAFAIRFNADLTVMATREQWENIDAEVRGRMLQAAEGDALQRLRAELAESA
jgi:hypothetical protein